MTRKYIGRGFSRPKSRICWLLRDKKIAKGWITLFFQKKIIIQLIGSGGKVNQQRQRCSTFCWETSQKQQNEARCAGLLERQGWRYGHGMKIGRRRKVLANLHPNGILTVGIFDTKLPFKTTHKWRYFSCVEFTLNLMHHTPFHTKWAERKKFSLVTRWIAVWSGSPYSSNKLLSLNSYHVLSSSKTTSIIQAHFWLSWLLRNSLCSVDSVHIGLKFKHSSYVGNSRIKELEFANSIGDSAVRHAFFFKLFTLRHLEWQLSPPELKKVERNQSAGNLKNLFCCKIFIKKVRLTNEMAL